MNGWESTLLPLDSTVLQAIRIIDQSTYLIALIVDNERRLLGTVTDGDIRRGILRNVSMDSEVAEVMTKTPVTAPIHIAEEEILRLFRKSRCRQIPLLDDTGRVAGIKKNTDVITPPRLDNPVLLMAGGLGTRLSPLTDTCPKPLLNIGQKPILSIILENFIEHGFHDFHISINYRGEMIENYFGDGSEWGVSIRYVKEKKRMGTAGALALLPEKVRAPLIVMNGDLLTKVNFRQLLDFHNENRSPATLCVREYDYQVPFGVVEVANCRLETLTEKPVQKLFINAGIYVLTPEVIETVPRDRFFDMTDLFSALLERGTKPTVFPIREYWLDIGRIGDYERAGRDFAQMNGKNAR